MQKTGQKFDINPETFTLANVFAMELHRFHDAIGEIVTKASKEMGIEKVGQSKNQTDCDQSQQGNGDRKGSSTEKSAIVVMQ